MPDILTVKTLGNFSVGFGDKAISDSSTRSHKLWKVFKYLITNRHKMVTVESLIEMLWPDQGPENPEKSLYTLISRLRKLINCSAENRCIIFSHDCYRWKPDRHVNLDVADFERLVKLAEVERDEKEKMRLLEQAADIYTGDYLSESAYEIWVMPVNGYYKRIYMNSVIGLADIYWQFDMMEEIIHLCGKAVENEPFDEKLHEMAIQAQFVSGNINEATYHFRNFTNLVKKEFGVEPSQEFLLACKSILYTDGKQSSLASIKRKLDGESVRSGAYFCTADIFNQMYAFDRRSDERIKFPVFLGLITLESDVKDNDDKSIKTAMVTLKECLVSTLRTGDIISQYSKNQFLLMLSARMIEDAKAAMVRVKRIFEEKGGSSASVSIHLSQVGSDEKPKAFTGSKR